MDVASWGSLVGEGVFWRFIRRGGECGSGNREGVCFSFAMGAHHPAKQKSQQEDGGETG
jgi:hypothetical protein